MKEMIYTQQVQNLFLNIHTCNEMTDLVRPPVCSKVQGAIHAQIEAAALTSVIVIHLYS